MEFNDEPHQPVRGQKCANCKLGYCDKCEGDKLAIPCNCYHNKMRGEKRKQVKRKQVSKMVRRLDRKWSQL